MNIVAPVSTIMTKNLITVGPDENLEVVKKHFEAHRIHHLPVVEGKEIIGIVSSTDFNHFLRGFTNDQGDQLIEASRLQARKVKDIMTSKLAKLDVLDSIRTALEVFKTNRIHALPVLENGHLVGIVTTYDIICELANEPLSLDDY